MNKQTVLLKKAYYALNTRNINAALSIMHQDIAWENGMHTGFVKGHEALRQFWTNEWQMTNPDVEPINITQEEDGAVVAQVRQIIRDLKDNVLSDDIVDHVFTIKEGLIASMHVRESMPQAIAV